nr:MAG TPA: hypothetical protein [Caudoviricetes sp.]
MQIRSQRNPLFELTRRPPAATLKRLWRTFG